MQSWTLSKLNSSLDLPSHHYPSPRSLRQTQTPTWRVHHEKSTTSMWQTLIFYIIALGACPISSLIPSPQYSTSPTMTMVYSGDRIHKSQVKLVVLGFPSPDLSPPVLAAAFDREGASKDSSRAETCMPGAAVSASEPKLWWSYLQLAGKKIHEFGRVFPQNRRNHVVNPIINLRASDFRDDYIYHLFLIKLRMVY